MSHHTTINTTAHPDDLGHTRREWTAALRWCVGRIDMERGQARGWEITQDASIWASLIEAGELTPWAEDGPATAPSATESAERGQLRPQGLNAPARTPDSPRRESQ